MNEYHPLTMLALDELEDLKDLSGLTLYKAESKRVPPLTPEEVNILLDEAKKGSRDARNRILMDCLALTIRFAEYKVRERNLRHSDSTDLIGVANISLLEKFPKALEQEDPIHFLMTEVLYDMNHYATYNDPMIQRKRWLTFDPHHLESVSLEAHERDLAHSLAAPETKVRTEEPLHPALQHAITQLTPIRRTAIIRKYGLYGNPQESVAEIAKSEGVSYRSIDSAQLNARRRLAKMLPAPSKR